MKHLICVELMIRNVFIARVKMSRKETGSRVRSK